MGAWPKHPKLLWALLFLNAIFTTALFAKDPASHFPLRLTILSAESHVLAGDAVPSKDCPLMNYSADCYVSGPPPTQNVLLVQDADGKSYRIECTSDSKWSECTPLSVGETIDARKEKRGITILYRNSKGKETKQFYQYVAAVPGSPAGATAVSAPHAAAPTPTSPAPAAVPPVSTPAVPAPGPVPAPSTRSAQEIVPGNVKCNFGSTPPGAEITLDGKYVGNTPSGIVLSTGTHSVIMSLPGFTQWKRELTVLPGSELTVSAVLQKEQQ